MRARSGLASLLLLACHAPAGPAASVTATPPEATSGGGAASATSATTSETQPAESDAPPGCASVAAHFTEQGDALLLTPPLRFEIDGIELQPSSASALRDACEAIGPLPRVEVRVVVHPDVAQSYRERSRDLPRERARALEITLRDLGCAEELDADVELDETTPTTGPPEIRFRFPACEAGRHPAAAPAV